jgi:rhamnosyltransferase
MIDVVILTYNGEESIEHLINALKGQSVDYNLIVIDSSSKDKTCELLKKHAVDYHSITSSEFNHGGTRNLALKYCTNDIVVYLTQDAIPANSESIQELISPLVSDPMIGLVYGKQLPNQSAGPIESFPRLFNYGSSSIKKTINDVSTLGMKVSFCSNSFAAYRVSILNQVGGFPLQTILGEDAFVASKMILEGYAVYYSANAKVYHSHNYTIWEEFKRYFDTGVFHIQQNWIINSFKAPNKEGMKFVKEEISYLKRTGNSILIPYSVIRNITKLIAYNLGKREKSMPLWLKRKVSMHHRYWK